MDIQSLFSPLSVGDIVLANRLVMAPMTRCRAIGNVPNQLMAEYYGQRASAGLIITEGTSPSPNGLGYARIPGLFSREQVEGWKLVTSAVHARGGRIFVQLMHTGRISHRLNLPEGAEVLAPSAVKPKGQMWTDSAMMQDFDVPQAMTEAEIHLTISEFVQASVNAIEAGFDGVELHSANGYLLEQFLSPVSNVRTDEYGGSIENRCRFVLDVTSAVAEAIGPGRTAIRLSPYGVASDMPHYPEIDATYNHLSLSLNRLGIAYIHLCDHSAMGAPAVPVEIKQRIRENFKNTLILAGGYDAQSASETLGNGLADLIAIGRPFINNPDLVSRYQNNGPLSTQLEMNLFYSSGAEGYTDYPVWNG